MVIGNKDSGMSADEKFVRTMVIRNQPGLNAHGLMAPSMLYELKAKNGFEGAGKETTGEPTHTFFPRGDRLLDPFWTPSDGEHSIQWKQPYHSFTVDESLADLQSSTLPAVRTVKHLGLSLKIAETSAMLRRYHPRGTPRRGAGRGGKAWKDMQPVCTDALRHDRFGT